MYLFINPFEFCFIFNLGLENNESEALFSNYYNAQNCFWLNKDLIFHSDGIVHV
jgi:hypothetical protein